MLVVGCVVKFKGVLGFGSVCKISSSMHEVGVGFAVRLGGVWGGGRTWGDYLVAGEDTLECTSSLYLKNWRVPHVLTSSVSSVVIGIGRVSLMDQRNCCSADAWTKYTPGMPVPCVKA